MYTKNQLQTACSSRVDFQNGLSYYNESKVQKITYNRTSDGSLVDLNAIVKGEHDDYSVHIIIDEGDSNHTEGKLSLYYCTCPGSNEKKRICKHSIAALLTYFDMRDNNVPGDEKEATQSKTFKQEIPEVKTETDVNFQKILTKENIKRRIEIRMKPKFGTMRMIPYITVNDISMNVEFKAGDSKLYIVKNIAEYVSAVYKNKSISYGKNKNILHDEALFDDGSKKILEFLCKYEQSKLTYVISYSQKNEEDYRFINLKKDILDRFFETVVDSEIKVNNCSTRIKNEIASKADSEEESTPENEDAIKINFLKYRVVKGKPELKFTLTGLDGNGALLTGTFPFVFSGTENYLFVEDGLFRLCPKSEFVGLELFFDYLTKFNKNSIYISEADLSLFVPDMLQKLKKCVSVEVVDLNESEYLPQAAAIKVYLDLPRRDTISCQVTATYGEPENEKVFNILAERDYSSVAIRNETAEMTVYESLKKYFNKYDPNLKAAILEKDDTAFYKFITEDIYELNELGEVFISDKIKNIKIKKASRINAGVSLQGDLLTFSAKSDDFTPQQLAELLAKYDRRKKFFRLTDGTFINIEGDGFENLASIGKMLLESGVDISSGVVEIPKYRALFLDNELSDTENLSISRSKDFRALIRNMKTFEDNDYEVPDVLKGTLRNYQKHGFRWIKTLKNNGFGGILADEMGLGKTVQTIAFLLSEHEENKNSGAIIICPASLVYNWKNEIERFAPTLKTVVVSGKQEERLTIIENIEKDDIVITSYDLLRRDIEYYKNLFFSIQIIDEAQYIKNSATLSSKAVKKINASFRLALTGTPIENRLGELWSIFDYLMPGFLHDYRQFKEDYETPIVTFKDAEFLTRLRKIIHPFVLRRLKLDVLKDLPEKLEESFTTKLTDEQNDLYMANLQRIKENIKKETPEQFKKGGIQILAELMRLRQICCDPSLIYEKYEGGSAKVDMCIDIIKRAIDGGHKILLFSQFTGMLDILEKRLDGEQIKYYSLVGQTPKEQRTQMVEDFNQGDVPVFCISLKAGGTGLNLTSADIVIHFDPWWNVAVQNQATDRAHRIGQKNVVTVYKLIAAGTIEENIMKLQEKKKMLATELLSGEEFNEAKFSKAELLEILG